MTDRLLVCLRARTNSRGVVLARSEVLQEELDCTPSELSVALEALESRRAIEVLTPLPYLVAKIRSWSGSEPKTASSYSYSSKPSKDISKSYGHSLEAREELLGEILHTLGEGDPAPFDPVLDRYTPEAIRRTLERVRLAKTIQKSKTALFRYLLPRIAKETSPHS